MDIILDNIDFTNDIFQITTPDGGSLLLNKLSESFRINGTDEDVAVERINIEIRTPEDVVISCPCVIGLGNELMEIRTNHKEYEGAVLTSDNMKYCTLTVYEY